MRAVLAVLVGIATAVPAHADEDLVAKRETCHSEASRRVKPRGTISADLARKLIARRMELVRECMEKPALASKDQPLSTGTVSAQRR